MRITLEDVKITATMARLYLSEEESRSLQVGLDQILSYATQLDEVDVLGVEPTMQMSVTSCPLREDELGPQFSVEVALKNAPQKEASFFAVPTILSKEEG